MPAWLLVTSIVLLVFLAYAVAAPVLLNLARFVGKTRLLCPQRHIYGEVRLNALGAALSSAYGPPRLRVRACSLLGRSDRCGQECLKHADL